MAEHYLHLVAVSDACGGAESLVLDNVVQYASSELRTVMMAKYDGSLRRRSGPRKQLRRAAKFYKEGAQ